MRLSSQVDLLDDYSILVRLDLSRQDDEEIANGLLLEAEQDGLTERESGSLIILTQDQHDNTIKCWNGESWDDFTDSDSTPKAYKSVLAVKRGIRKLLDEFSPVRLGLRPHAAFWLREDVNFEMFKKYSVITGIGLFLLAKRSFDARQRYVVECSICANKVQLRRFEDHVRKCHFDESFWKNTEE